MKEKSIDFKETDICHEVCCNCMVGNMFSFRLKNLFLSLQACGQLWKHWPSVWRNYLVLLSWLCFLWLCFLYLGWVSSWVIWSTNVCVGRKKMKMKPCPTELEASIILQVRVAPSNNGEIFREMDAPFLGKL